MTGELRLESADFQPGTHDHLALIQKKATLVFRDPRLFGRIRFSRSVGAPEWWTRLPVPITSPEYTPKAMATFLARHERLSIKAALLLQAGFPGIGNWMADEILWRARIHPRLLVKRLTPEQLAALWKALRFVSNGALRHVGNGFSDPPAGWLFQERWGARGRCPIHRQPLRRATIGGRTTAWCPVCQGKMGQRRY
jgi:formamidopyrimidine-DNA glycosylase